MAEARPAGTAAPRPPAARGGARGLPPPGTSPAPPHPLPHAGRRGRCPLRPSAPVLCPPRSPRGRGPVLLPAERIPDSPPPHTHTHSRHLLSQERGGESASPQRRRPHPSRPGEPPLHLPLSRRRAQAPLSPEHGARRRGCPRAGDSAPAATSHPGAPRPRGQRRQRPPSPTPSPRPPPRQRSSPPPPGPLALPPSPGTAARRGTKRRSPAPLPAGGAYLLQGRQQHQRQRRQDPRRRSRYPAHGGEEGRRQGGPQQSRSAAGARGAGRGEQRGGSGSGSCRGLRTASAPACRSRLPRRWLPAAALAHGQRCSGGRERRRERERGAEDG